VVNFFEMGRPSRGPSANEDSHQDSPAAIIDSVLPQAFAHFLTPRKFSRQYSGAGVEHKRAGLLHPTRPVLVPVDADDDADLSSQNAKPED
jgi:hypothetical protein